VAPLEAPDAVLCRSNAEAVSQVMAAGEAGRSAALVGGGNEVRRLAEAAIDLKAGRGTDHPELLAFRTWGEVQEYVTHDSAGQDLKVAVKLIDTHGPDVVIATVNTLVEEQDAQVVVSTAHKAKGREWDTVRIANDFHEPKSAPVTNGSRANDQDEREVSRAEMMLAYVAVTRAREVLDRAGLAWVDRLMAAQEPAETAAPPSPPSASTPRDERAPLGRVEVVTRDLPPAAYTGAARWLLRDRHDGALYVAVRGDDACRVFPANQRGDVTDWGQLVGKAGATHEQAIADLERVLAGGEAP
jgi:hypothetical protein